MNNPSRFGAAGCYSCDCCGRATRQTGSGDNESCGLCVECYEQAQIENQMADDGETPALLAERQGYIDACKAKGGKPSEQRWW